MPVASPTERKLVHVQKHARLPVWPVLWGGRVQPMQLDPVLCDPFLMLVHHRHSFARWDPVRPLSALVMPEGFPAHPHRGFETVTYVLEGAMRHRDSAGIKMVYRGESAQWLTAGRGVLHEEMWAHEKPGTNRHELYQLWVNLPRAHKLDPPQIQLLGEGDVSEGAGDVSRAPMPVTEVDGVRLTVLAGAVGGVRSPIHTRSPIAILRLSWAQAGPAFAWDELPPEHTALLFVRSGAVDVAGQKVVAGELARFERSATAGPRVRITAVEAATDVLLLTGKPLGEPVVMAGSMVMSTAAEIDQANRDYQRGMFGVPWPYQASDAEWLAAVRRG
jgi:redox-sensitive bicupin YhaK (pirin superfamily)